MTGDLTSKIGLREVQTLLNQGEVRCAGIATDKQLKAIAAGRPASATA